VQPGQYFFVISTHYQTHPYTDDADLPKLGDAGRRKFGDKSGQSTSWMSHPFRAVVCNVRFSTRNATLMPIFARKEADEEAEWDAAGAIELSIVSPEFRNSPILTNSEIRSRQA
jgi:hypothetical protein